MTSSCRNCLRSTVVREKLHWRHFLDCYCNTYIKDYLSNITKKRFVKRIDDHTNTYRWRYNQLQHEEFFLIKGIFFIYIIISVYIYLILICYYNNFVKIRRYNIIIKAYTLWTLRIMYILNDFANRYNVLLVKLVP